MKKLHQRLRLHSETLRELEVHRLTAHGGARYYSLDQACGPDYTVYRWCNSEPQYCGTTI